MLLPQQLQAILYHFIMGWVYGCTFSFLCSFTAYIAYRFLRGTIEVLFHILFTTLCFWGLYNINGGISNIYLLAFFLAGVFIYYTWYLSIFLQLFQGIRNLLRPIVHKLVLVKSKILGIIRVTRKRLTRSIQHGKKHNKHKRKAEKTDTSDEEVD